MADSDTRTKAAIDRKNNIAKIQSDLDAAQITSKSSSISINHANDDIKTAIDNAKKLAKTGTLSDIVNSQTNIHNLRLKIADLQIQDIKNKANLNKLHLNLNAAVADDIKKTTLSNKIDIQNDNISLQNKSQLDLSTTITNYQQLLNVKEGFTDQITLPTNSNQELNIYVNSFNSAVALLDDPNQMNKVAFDTYIHIQEKKLRDLDVNIAKLEKNVKAKVVSPVKGIRSMNNSNIINVQEFAVPAATISNNSNVNYPYYLLYGNNGCLQYETPSSNKSVSSTWNFMSCNANEPKQQFKINKINNIDQYNNPITNTNNKNYKIQSDSLTKYGFYSVNPSIAYDQCLQLNNDGISVMPCTMNSSQRFTTNYHSVLE